MASWSLLVVAWEAVEAQGSQPVQQLALERALARTTGGTGKNEKGFNKYRFPQRSNMQGAGRGSRMFSGFCNRLRSMLARSGTWRPIMLQMCICHIRRMAKHLEEHMAVIQCIIRGRSAKRNRIFKAHKLCALNIRFVLLTYL